MHAILWEAPLSPRGTGLARWLNPLLFHRSPVSLSYAYLAAILKRHGHTAEHATGELPAGADLCFLQPCEASWPACRELVREVRRMGAGTRFMVVGEWAVEHANELGEWNLQILKGEPEQLHWVFDDVLSCSAKIVQLGQVADLDTLPWPDWSLFQPRRFRLSRNCWHWPAGQVLLARPGERKRQRAPERIVSEIRHGMQVHGFRAFSCGEGVFAPDRDHVLRLAELLARLPEQVQFSLTTRTDLMPNDVLRALSGVGLACVTVEVDAPRMEDARQEFQPLRDEDRTVEFVTLCRSLGIRTVARFLPPESDKYGFESRALIAFARRVNATYVELPAGNAGSNYYCRWDYAKHNAHLLWPGMARIGQDRRGSVPAEAQPAHSSTPKPLGGLDALRNHESLRKDGPHQRHQARRNHGPMQ